METENKSLNIGTDKYEEPFFYLWWWIIRPLLIIGVLFCIFLYIYKY